MHKSMWKHMITLGHFNLLRQRTTRINKYSKNNSPSWNPYDNWSGTHKKQWASWLPTLTPQVHPTHIQMMLLQPLHDSGDYVAACRPTHKHARMKNRSCSPAAHEHIYRNQNRFINKLNGLEHIPNHINECSCARIWTHCLRPLAKRLRLLYQKLAALS